MMGSASAVAMTGRGLTPAAVAEIARERRAVEIAPDARRRVETGRAVVDDYLAGGLPVYGLNTGLGARVAHDLPGDALAEFSRMTIRGRANAVGPPLPADIVRAILAVRLNGFLGGASGVSVAVADALVALLNAGVHPVMPSIGSVGAGDLCLLAHVGLALIGEGELEIAGQSVPAAEGLAAAGLAPLAPGPKDGLAICNASAATAGMAALALHDADAAYALSNVAAALAMEGFRANVSPLDARMAAIRPQPGQAAAAAALRGLLDGGSLLEPGAARRLQDPISLRCVAQVHGALAAALAFAAAAVDAEINGESTNPAVLAGDGEILSTGNFHAPLLALSLDTLAQALAQVAALSVARMSKQLSERLSGLPANLSRHGPTRSGFAPLHKPAEALLGEIRHFAMPLPGGPSLSAEGIEDHMTHAPQAAGKLAEVVRRLRRVLAIELIVAAQAIELRGVDRLGAGTAKVHRAIRDVVAPLDDDRPHGLDIERLDAELLANGRLLEIIGGAA